jgi:c-di-GMP-related signal transduction protein
MSLFGKTFELEHMIEKAMEHIDMEQITADVMKDLKIIDLDMFFVVCKPDGSEDYDFVGMAYSIESARELKETVEASEILKLDMMKMVPMAKSMGFVEPVL